MKKGTMKKNRLTMVTTALCMTLMLTGCGGSNSAAMDAMSSNGYVSESYDGGWGDYIMINHGNNLISLYAHLNSRSVKRGDTVTAGQEIGTTGNSGISSGPHLHFELRENGKAVNPFRYTFE